MPSYAELHCHSNFSLLDGASHPEDLVLRAAELGMPALALTDHDAVYGATRFLRAARAAGVHPLLGAELSLQSGHHLTLLVENETGWHNLCYLISRARAQAPKGQASLPDEELVGCSEGLIALSGCRQGAVAAALLARRWRRARKAAQQYLALFGRERFWIELQNHYRPQDALLVSRLSDLAQALDVGCVVTNNVHYARREGSRLQDVLVCIGHNVTLDEATDLRRVNSEYYLKGASEMAALFPDHPQALENTLRLAQRCQFDLQYGLQDLPRFETPHGMSSSAYLRRLCQEGLQARYDQTPDAVASNVREQLQRELQLIEEAGLANYFLIVGDIVRFARREGIRCQGRGSAANSLVAYLLHISPIDPVAHDLVFERFLSAERLQGDAGFMPDIDIDFDAARREEVIQHLYTTYGEAHTAMACTFVTFRRRSALRDVGRALGLSPQAIVALQHNAETGAVRPAQAPPLHAKNDKERAKALTTNPEARTTNSDARTMNSEARTMHSEAHTTNPDARATNNTSSPLHPLTPSSSPRAHVLALAQQIAGFPRHLGIHSGGMIISGAPLMGRAPTEPATMPDRVVVQWDKEGLEDAGLVKIDVLGLRMLSAISETLALIAAQGQTPPDLEGLTFDDPAVYAMIAGGETLGVFQVESRAQTQLLPLLQPRCFDDLIVAISLIRPGPIQGNMVHPYLRRRRGMEPVAYAHPLLEPALRETLGVILFQEQVLKVARDLAGFTGGQGEQLRRALGAKEATAAIDELHDAFLQGAQRKSVSREIAETVFEQLRAFGGYSFAKSHAAAFAVLVYQAAWLRKYHFLPFFTALLNNQPMGFWSPSVLVNEVKRKGRRMLPVSIHHSQARCTLEGDGQESAIRLGLNVVKGLGEAPIERILAARQERPFTSLVDFCRRARLSHRLVENLIRAGAMDGDPHNNVPGAESHWGAPRRQLLWELGTLRAMLDEQADALELEVAPLEADLPPLTPVEALAGEQAVQGLSSGEHLMAHLRPALRRAGLCRSVDLALRGNGESVQVAGLLVVHQSPPTAKGFHFLTLEDEEGLLDVIVRPKVYERFRRVLHTERLLRVAGTVQKEGGNTNVLARAIAPLETGQG